MSKSRAVPSDALFNDSELESLVGPPTKKRRGAAETPFEAMPGVKDEIKRDFQLLCALRQELHAQPELGFEEKRTSARVAELLRSWGIEVTHGQIGGATGVIGTLKGLTPSDKSIGLRADMDGLPLEERSDVEAVPYKSTNGVMHACGHDGHITMLLGAAKYLAETRRFSGTVSGLPNSSPATSLT